nr:immunoglobulin light chain junction region [Macaca mulatta]MOV65495.1 immunoglobulin light chain junction region [Macaca mulatta]MOW40430.1 immunoglobulin light chain junction region [Macaca mulatta]MOW40480.1 immunoglobulin light chain junction region [Macaca mulatta]
CLQNSNWPLTF